MAKKVASTVPIQKEPSLLEFAGQAHKNLIKNGQIPDPEKVKELAADPLIHEQSVEDYYPNLPGDYYDKYEDYINPYTLKGRSLSLEEMNQKRFENQTLGQELGHAVGRIATNIVPQIISGYASMLDLPGYWDAEHAANNSIVNWAMDLKKDVDENMFPIYTDPSNPNMDLTSSAWWASRGSGLVESIGSFLAQGAGIGKGISLLGKGIGAMTKGKALFSALESIPGINNGAKFATATGRNLQTLASATMLNQSEAVIEATQVYKDTYDNAIKANLDEKTARENAANAASTTMNLNRINILLNLTSASAFLKPMKGVGRNLLKAETLGTGLKEVAKESGQEAIEELVNHVASKKGMAVGERKNYGFADALKDMGSMEGLEAAFLGAIGGMVQTGGTNLLQGSKYGPGSTKDESGNRVSAKQYKKDQYEKQQAIIEDLKSKGIKVNESLMNIKDMMLHQEKLKTAKTPEEAKELNEQFFETQVLKHAQAGTLEVLEGLYKAEAERPIEEVGEEYINNAKEAIKNLKSLERVYNNYEGYENKDELYFNRANDIRTSKYLKQATIDQQQATVDLGTKVNEIAKKYKFKTEREVLIKKDGKVVDTEKKSDEIPMPYSMMNLEENTADTAENKAVYDKFLAEIQKLPEYKTSKQLTDTLDAITKLKEDNDSEFEKLTSEEHQAKVVEEKRKQEIVKELHEKLKKANTVSEIEKLKASTEDVDFKKQADEKLDQVKEANKGAAANKAKDLLQKQFVDKIGKATLETVEDLRKEIDNSELSQERKTQLHEALDKKNAVLNGEEVEETEGPLSMFKQVSEEEVKGNTASNDTTIPTDLPNPETEETTVEAEVEEAAQKLLEQDGVVIGQDEKGNLIYSYNRTVDGSDKGAFLSREFNQTENIGVIEREEFTNKLTDNKQVLDPDFLTPGTALEIEVDTEYKGEKYKSDSTERETIQWELRLVELQQLAVDRGVALTALPEYIAEVPIKVTTKDGKTVFYVHDNAWYKAENIDNTAEEIQAQKDLNFQLRKKVIAGKQKSKITHKGPGKLFKSANNEQIAVSEAMPDTNLVLGVGKDKNGVMQTELPNDVETLLGKDATIIPTTIQNGRPYAIIKVGPNTYLPVALQRSTLSQEVVDSIMFAIEAHLINDAENPVVKAIQDKAQLDILSTDGLAKYLNQFIYLYRTEGSEGLESVLLNQSNKLKSTNFLLAVTANGIEFGKPGTQMGNSIKKGQFRLELSQNFKKQSPVALSALRENLKDMLANMSINDLKLDNNTVIVLDADGNTQTTKYKEFVKTSHTTNLLSVNVGTEEQPKWVYTIQPNITFDTSFAQTTGGKKATTTTSTTAPIVTPTVVKAKLEQPSTQSTQSAESLQQQIDDARAKEKVENAEVEVRRKYSFSAELGISKGEDKKIGGLYINEEGKSQRITGKSIKEVKDKINAKYDKKLADIYKRYDAIISPLLEQLEASKPTAEEEVETATEEVLINEAVKNFTTADEISNISKSINNGSIPLEVLAQTGLTFSTKEEAVAFFNKVKAQFEKNASETKTSKLSNGRVIIRSKNKKDSEPINDETFEDDLPESLTQEQVDELKPETEGMIVRGISPSTQESLIAFLASDILKQTLSAKDINRKQKVKTGPILANHRKSFKELAKIYREDGLLNLAAQCDAIVEQFDKVSKLTNQHMSVLVTGSVNEDVDLDESEETVGLQKLVYNDDWTFTINALAGTSVDLKRFFSGIQLVDENGPVDNALGFPEMVSMNTVYNTLQEVLANKPSDFDTMMQVLELYTEKFPWFKSVIEELENGSEKIQNEFVTTMTKHSINMEFLMWSKDRNGNYVLRKWSSNSSSIEQRLRDIWESNLRGTGTKSNIVKVSEETGEYVFNKAELNQLIKTAETWMSYSDSEIANLPFDELATWLGNLGIVIQDKTYKDLKEGQFSNNGRLVWKALFTNDKGLVKVLTKSLQKIVDQNLTVAEAELLNDSVVKSLAKLDARNNLNTFSNSFQAGGKTIYSYGNNNYLVNRMRDLTMYDNATGKFVNEDLINKLNSISFTKDSIWLKELQNSKELGEITRNSLGTNYLSLEALKKLFTQTQDNRKLNNLTSAEHEVVKIGFFQTGQGSIINGAERRLVSFFYPTMSDKSTMLSVRALAQQYKTEDGEIAKSNVNLLYEGLVLPEINRIRDKQPDNIKGYEANYFYFLPALNNLMITLSEDAEGNAVQKSFLDIVKDGDDVVYREDVREAVNTEIKNIFNQLVEDKLNNWEKLGIGQTLVDSKGRKTDQYTFLDKTYMSKVAKGGQGKPKVKYAASDYVFNYLIANAESFKLFAGDPALYAKFKSESKYAKELNKAVEDLTEQDKQDLLKANLEETFINIGKRLAGDIAPGMELANSKDNNYYQVFLKDKELGSKNLKDSFQKEYFNKIINNYSDAKKGYGAMEGSDAQEYTTWKEHLYVLKQLGRLTTEQYNIINRKLTAQSEGKINNNTKLSYDEVEIVLQPIKPVYVGNISSVEDNVDRRVYIKSSSFPLIPEFTVGLQLEKVRKGLEKFETEKSTEVNKDGSPIFVRASFGTANKVGAPLSSVDVFDNNGDVVDNFNVVDDNTLLLSRANFRIQQDVPYNREKDSINIGTQERKLLFVNLLDVEIEDGVTGQDLLKVYNQTYQELFKYAQENLSKKLGLRQTVKTKLDLQTFMTVPTTTIFDTVEQVVADRGKLSAVKKTLLDSELNDTLKEYGDDTYDRVNYINKNFDKIVESLLSIDNGIFTDKENYKKDC